MKEEKKHGILLNIWIAIIFLANIVTVLAFFAERFILGISPVEYSILLKIPLFVIYVPIIIAAINVILIVFVFKWKKLAFFAFCILSVISFIFSEIFLHSLTYFEIIGPVILYILLLRKWKLLE